MRATDCDPWSMRKKTSARPNWRPVRREEAVPRSTKTRVPRVFGAGPCTTNLYRDDRRKKKVAQIPPSRRRNTGGDSGCSSRKLSRTCCVVWWPKLGAKISRRRTRCVTALIPGMAPHRKAPGRTSRPISDKQSLRYSLPGATRTYCRLNPQIPKQHPVPFACL